MAAPARLSLQMIPEHRDEQFLSKRWEDFDHSQKINLGIWGSAWSIRDRETNERLVLQSCPQRFFDRARYRLLEVARRRADLFATPKYLFFRGGQVYVCSEIAGISLAEVIDGTTSITEAQVATILKRVAHFLFLTSNPRLTSAGHCCFTAIAEHGGCLPRQSFQRIS